MRSTEESFMIEGYAVTKIVVPQHLAWTPEGNKTIPEMTLYAGDVFRGLRNEKDKHEAFSSTVILGFSHPTRGGNVYAKVARPYAYASSIGCTGPTVLLGCEEYIVRVEDITDHWTRIDTNRVAGGFDTIEPHSI